MSDSNACRLYEDQDTEVEDKNIKVLFQSYSFSICLCISHTPQLSFSFPDLSFFWSPIFIYITGGFFFGCLRKLALNVKEKCSMPLSNNVMLIVHTLPKLLLWRVAGLLCTYLIPGMIHSPTRQCTNGKHSESRSRPLTRKKLKW